uniref:DUF86 domain-containing protein n=1 Tax=Gracilinema caldarium TaxID=215591 RepID=A0A7C3EFM7_9SPIR
MSDSALLVLEQNLTNLVSSLRWLKRSYDHCQAIGLRNTYTEDEFDAFENLCSRYARTTDLIINKVLRSIDAVEFIEAGSLIDATNRAEKRGIIDSVSELRDFKDLRNEIVHEYETEDLTELFALVFKAVPNLITVAERILHYCERYQAPNQ